MSSHSKPGESVYKFGVEEHSDVVFVVGKARFHCHKMMLAARSNYFASMFTSNFKEKDQKEVTIKADERAFRQLMQILYNGYFTGCRSLFGCNAKAPNVSFNGFHIQIWKESSLLLDLADRFLVLDIVLPCVESGMIRCEQYCKNKKECRHCAVKLLLALRYRMNDYAKMNASKNSTIRRALDMFEGRVEIPLSTEALKVIMDRK